MTVSPSNVKVSTSCEIPAVKHKIARILVGLDGLFAVDVGADEALEIVDVLLRGVLADDGRGLAQPEVVILAVEDDGEQIRIGRAVFSGNVGQDTEIGGRFCFFPGLRLSGFFGLFRGLRRGGLGVRGRRRASRCPQARTSCRRSGPAAGKGPAAGRSGISCASKRWSPFSFAF